MCGIAGIVYNEAGRAIADGHTGRIARMLGAIKYRGPDDSGEYYFNRCALGHVRLSIVDLKGGKQPMIRPKLGIVFNGEIYGYKDIRSSLAQSTESGGGGGYTFETESDTEVIIALYREYGTKMMEHLPGMFAFAMWDDETQTLFCARDRFGEKPFYYATGKGGEFIFASEIKAILSSGLVEPVLDYEQMRCYLMYSYVYPTRTIYRNIHILPPAHTLTYHDGKVDEEQYWHLPRTNTLITEQEAVEEFRRLFKQAVRRQLVADVPVAAFLSGGLDSGSVAATAAQEVPQLTTISFAFKNGIDESPLARTMAEKYHTNHIELHDIDFDIADMLQKMQTIFDEPFADPAAIPAYLISKAAREYATVVLTGDAGDEILGGYYDKYAKMAYVVQLQDMPYLPRKLHNKMTKAQYAFSKKTDKLLRRAGLEKKSAFPLQNRDMVDLEIRMQVISDVENGNRINDTEGYCRKISLITPPKKLEVLGLHPATDDYIITDGYLDKGDADNAIRYDLLEYLPGNGFVKTDRTSMAVSLESRTPFCDKDLAEFCISLPFDMKVRGKDSKYIMRRTIGDLWTKPVRHGLKNGFAPPFDKWMNERNVVDLVHYYLADPKRKIFEAIPYYNMWDYMREKAVWPEVWTQYALLNLSMWMESHPCKL